MLYFIFLILDFISSLDELLDDISKYYDEKKNTEIIPNIEKRIHKFKEELSDLIDNKIDEQFLLDINYEKYGDISRSKPKYLNHKVTTIYHDFASVSYEVEITIKFRFFPTPLDIYNDLDTEDYRPRLFSETLNLICDLEFHYDKDNNIKLKWVNLNEKIRLKTK